ncbi:hypothetical protein LX36DRAFT_233813 [Colletotrichum falcatum]|nr:hypothetical protein LX36DRAFT_233813 [Colletotrichum falcatum]
MTLWKHAHLSSRSRALHASSARPPLRRRHLGGEAPRSSGAGAAHVRGRRSRAHTCEEPSPSGEDGDGPPGFTPPTHFDKKTIMERRLPCGRAVGLAGLRWGLPLRLDVHVDIVRRETGRPGPGVVLLFLPFFFPLIFLLKKFLLSIFPQLKTRN